MFGSCGSDDGEETHLGDMIFADRYVLGDKIGSGESADTYKAHDKELNRTVAVKVLRQTSEGNRAFSEQFHQEVQSAAGLNHPNIVQVYDSGTDEGKSYVVMELLEGQSLRTIIDKRGPLRSSDASSLTIQVCKALDHAHKNGVIHKDVRPQNIMVGKTGDVKVTDFAIAQTSDQPSGMLLGAATYASPEKAEGKALVPQSDIYSLGIILYEMLTGHLPFVGADPSAVLRAQIDADPIRPTQYVPDLRVALENVVLRCLEKNPGNRFMSADALSKSLQPFIGEMPKEEEKGGRKAGLVILIVAAAILVGLLTAYAMTRPDGPTVATPDLVGLQLGDARTELTNAGLLLGEISDEPDDIAPLGQILSQRPRAGADIEEGGTVDVAVAVGPEDIAVPTVTGQTFASATTAIQDAGLATGEVDEEYSSSVSKGLIISQSPKAGRNAAKDSPVDLVLSQGPEPVETTTTTNAPTTTSPAPTTSTTSPPAEVVVPSLIGLTRAEALAKLNQAGLKAVEEEEYSDTVPAGTVTKQSPTAANSVPEGSTVTVFLSKGPQP